jgi:hypothetical protein
LITRITFGDEYRSLKIIWNSAPYLHIAFMGMSLSIYAIGLETKCAITSGDDCSLTVFYVVPVRDLKRRFLNYEQDDGESSPSKPLCHFGSLRVFGKVLMTEILYVKDNE